VNRPQRNNNPINIKLPLGVDKLGEATGKDADGFAIFPTPMAGWRAAFRQIKTDADRGENIRQFIERFAPSNENDTEAYINFVITNLDTYEDMELKHLSPYALAGVMAAREGYFAKEAS
jgi:hypothetical protein